MDEDGSFLTKDVQLRMDLSATEEILFQYLCFLEVNRFWSEVKKLMGRTAKKPLFISALPDHIDFCVDLASLLEQALALNRQVFLFTGDKRIGERMKNVAEKQVIYCEQS